MTHRDRLLPQRASASPPPGPFWEAWYQAASPEQREQALALARRHGVVPAHKLPGHAAPPPRPSSLLSALLADQAAPTPFNAPPLQPLDATLDACQRRAVARALHTPDVALIAGPAGTGKSRAVAELLHQALARGETVLFASAGPTGTFAALERLSPEAQSATVLLADPPPALRHLTLAARAESLRRSAEQAPPAQPLEELRHLAQAVTDAAARLIEKSAALQGTAEAVAAERAALPEALRREQQDASSPLGRACRAALDEAATQDAPLAARAAGLHARGEQLRAEAEQRRARRESLSALAEARAAGRWWSLAWWQALFAGDLAGQLGALGREDDEGRRQAEALEKEAGEVAASRKALAEQAEKRRQQLLDEGLASREAGLAARSQEAAREHQWAESEWSACWSRLLPEVPPFTAEGREEGAKRVQARVDAEEAAARARARWTEALRDALPHLGPLLVSSASIVAGPAETLLGREGPWGLLVVEDAHQLSEELLLGLAARAPRWALFGEPTLPALPLPNRPPRPPASPFHLLWERLHPDPRRHAARWHRRRGRLVASLRPIAEGAPSHWEPLYDRPEVEVCIARPAGEDEERVCEVSFPDQAPIAEARAFIRKELDELAVEPATPAAYWSEEAGKIVLSLCGDMPAEVQSVPVLAGVEEQLIPCARPRDCPGWHTARLVFDPAQGWDRARAHEWAKTNLALRDLGRTAWLACSHRAAPQLAAFLGECLYRGPVSAPAPHVEFVPVPEPTGKAQPNGGRPRPARGANLEVDLAALRGPHPAIPPQAHLPPSGVVNPAEAQAVLAWLTRHLADGPFRDEALAWHRRTGQPPLAVLSPSPAQVALLRATLGSLEAPLVDVGDVEGFRGRECYAALVSLVRSLGTQAPPFSRHPDDLVCLFTRACSRLVLFGDPGSMLRRGQWYGPLEHQDDHAGPREQALMQSLTGCWPELMAAASDPGTPARPSPRSSGMRESSSV